MARSTRRKAVPWLFPSLVLVALASAIVAQSGTPAIQVTLGTVNVAHNGTVDFGTTPVGVASSKAFSVKNTGKAALRVSEEITVPVGFTLMASFPDVPTSSLGTGVPAYVIQPGQTATFTVALNSAVSGPASGEVTFRTNVSTRQQFIIKVKGTSLPPPGVRYQDDRDAGFTFTSGWKQVTAPWTMISRPFQRTVTQAVAGAGKEVATWTFTGLEPGEYAVAATWRGVTSGASNAPFTVLDNTTPLATLKVDQRINSLGFVDGGSEWQSLGTFTITGTTLAVKLTDEANGAVFADGVRIARAGYDGGVVDDASRGFAILKGEWEPGFIQSGGKIFQGTSTRTKYSSTNVPTAVARWSFAVEPGTYRVLAGFQGYSWAAPNSPYRVYDDATELTASPIRVNQRVTPANLTDGGVGWLSLGFFTVKSNTLHVELNNNAREGYVNADAMRVERVNTATVPSTPDTIRFLQQATWGPRQDQVDLVRRIGFNAWLESQFAATETSYPTMPSYSTNDNITNNNTTSCFGDPTVQGNPARSACIRDHYQMYPLQTRFFSNALYGEDQLRQRMAWALHKIWVISGIDVIQPAWVTPYLQILSTEAFGNYRSLSYKITLNGGMGVYLDMSSSTRTRPNENYPRELLQLFTIGLDELNPDGTLKLRNGIPIPTYEQDLINNMTKVFTGWRLAPQFASGIPNYIDAMRLNGAATENANNHDFTSKTLLRGFVQPARTASVANAYADLNEALDNINSHPSMAPFISKQLIQQLVTSNPSPAYVARVSDAFNRHKPNSNQMREVVRAILLDPEARGDRKNAVNYGHLKEPVLLITNVARAFDAKSADRTANSDGYLNPDSVNLGQDAFRPGSVFSYFSPFKVAVGGNPPTVGPEFQGLTTSTALRRVNFGNQAVTPNSSRAIDVIRNKGTTPAGVDPVTGNPLVPTGPAGTSIDVLTPLLAFADNPSGLADVLNAQLLHGTMSPEMKADVVTAVTAVARTNPRKRVRTAVYLVITSSQYQVQK